MRHRSLRSQGTTLLELAVSLGVFVVFALGALGMLDQTAKVAKVQQQMADIQQNQRVAHHELARAVRMAGRGGLAGSPPLDQTAFPFDIPVSRTAALEVRDNVTDAADRRVAIGLAGSPQAVSGTDIVAVRGVLTSPVYLVDYRDPAVFTPPTVVTPGSVTVRSTTEAGIEQDLTPLADAIARAANPQTRDALVLVSALDPTNYGVVRITGGVAGPTAVTVTVDWFQPYAQLSEGGALPALQKVSYAGVVEEYRYYVREDLRGTELWPALSRARVYPNTQVPFLNDAANLREDLVEGMFDLQAALVFDTTLGGRFADDSEPPGTPPAGFDDRFLETADGTNDDVLFNAPGASPAATPRDDTTQPPWAPPPGLRKWDKNKPRPPAALRWDPQPTLYQLRLTTVTRTNRADPGFQAPILSRVEDHVYAPGAPDPLNGPGGRAYRRRVEQTVVDLRSQG
jgi:hypothetical protein